MTVELEVQSLLQQAVTKGAHTLQEPEAKQLLTQVAPGVRVPAGHKCRTVDEAVEAATRIGYPVAVKIISPEALHKSDVGGVHLGLRTDTEVAAACRSITALGLTLDGFLVEEMVPSGPELLVGCSMDPTFGPTISFGLGGTLVELLDEVSVRVVPITRADALDMLGETKAARLLNGFRNYPPLDVDGLVELLLAVGGSEGLMARHSPPVQELDINPLIPTVKGLYAVDVRVVLHP